MTISESGSFGELKSAGSFNDEANSAILFERRLSHENEILGNKWTDHLAD